MSRLALSLLRTAGALAVVAWLATAAYAQDAPTAESPAPESQDAPTAESPAPESQDAPTAEPPVPVSKVPERRRGFPPGLAEARLIKDRVEVIGVSEETLEKLEKLVAEIREKEEELGAKTLETENRIRVLLDAKMPEEKALLAAGGAAADVNRETRRLRLRSSLRVRALLTKEQLEKFMEIRSKAMGKVKRRRGGRPRLR
jgi:hypothetical protein